MQAENGKGQRFIRKLFGLTMVSALLGWSQIASAAEPIRFATFNASLNRTAAGQLIADLSTTTNTQARAVAEIIQRVRPDVLLINEFDFDSAQPAAAPELFRVNYLQQSQRSAPKMDVLKKRKRKTHKGVYH